MLPRPRARSFDRFLIDEDNYRPIKRRTLTNNRMTSFDSLAFRTLSEVFRSPPTGLVSSVCFFATRLFVLLFFFFSPLLPVPFAFLRPFRDTGRKGFLDNFASLPRYPSLFSLFPSLSIIFSFSLSFCFSWKNKRTPKPRLVSLRSRSAISTRSSPSFSSSQSFSLPLCLISFEILEKHNEEGRTSPSLFLEEP